MPSSTRGRRVGAHRAQRSHSLSTQHVALAAAAATAVTVSGTAGAALAHPPAQTSVHLTADAQKVTESSSSQAPQVLAIAEFKPLANLDQQIHTAAHLNAEREEKDRIARSPEVVKPAEGVLTSTFGQRWGVLHAGIDIANSMGTPIVAASDGVVIDAGPASGFGQWVRVKHEDGTITVYGHIETIDVTVGQHVSAGEKIAGMGSRGFSTGVHLHFEVHPNGGAPIDPIPWLAERGISV